MNAENLYSWAKFFDTNYKVIRPLRLTWIAKSQCWIELITSQPLDIRFQLRKFLFDVIANPNDGNMNASE